MPRIPCHTLGGLLAALALLPLGASAQTPAGLPGHAVKFVNNFPPGGPSDIIARSLSAELKRHWTGKKPPNSLRYSAQTCHPSGVDRRPVTVSLRARRASSPC